MDKKTALLEVIAFNIESCRIIEQCGGHRIELCDNPGEGGTTPSAGLIEAARKLVAVDLFPIIRPRGGDFLYSADEFNIMSRDILLCKDLGCDGVVLGMLNINGEVDTRCEILVGLAYPMEVTFHRAFDRVRNAESSLEKIIQMGFTRILTSGLKSTAMEGATTLAGLVKQADERITIMPGSGIRSANIRELRKLTGATEFHTSARKLVESKMEYTGNFQEILQTVTIDDNEIRNILEMLSPSVQM